MDQLQMCEFLYLSIYVNWFNVPADVSRLQNASSSTTRLYSTLQFFAWLNFLKDLAYDQEIVS